MDMTNKTLEAQADLLAEEALHELGDTLLDETDDYAGQCDYAGCFPWLAEVICAHPYESAPRSLSHGGDAAGENTDYSC